jgi:hypothetical protein
MESVLSSLWIRSDLFNRFRSFSAVLCVVGITLPLAWRLVLNGNRDTNKTVGEGWFPLCGAEARFITVTAGALVLVFFRRDTLLQITP